MAKQLALVTGGSKGIGYAIFEALAKEGINVAIAARKVDDLKKAVDTVKQKHDGDHTYVSADFSDLKNVPEVLQKVHDTYGKWPEIIVASAGEPSGNAFIDTPVSDLQKKWMLEYFSIHELFRQAASKMNNGGFLFALSSHAGLEEKVLPGMSGYAPIKAAVNKLCNQISQELSSQNIRAFALCPPSVNTPGLHKVVDQAWDAIKEPLAKKGVNTPDEYYEQVLQPSEIGDSVVVAIKKPQTPTITYRKVIEF